MWVRIRRSKVAQWTALYLAGAWVLLEVAGFMVDWFALPAAWIRMLTAVLATGTIAAVVVAWYHGEKGRQTVSRREAALLALTGLFAVVLAAVARPDPGIAGVAPMADGDPDPARVVVLFFEDLTPGKPLQYLAESFTESLTHELSQIDGLEIVSHTGVKALRDRAVSPDSLISAVQAGTIIDGSMETIGDRLRVTVRLMSGATGSQLISARVERAGSDMIRLREELVHSTAQLLRRHLGRTIELRDVRVGTRSDEAWSQYAKARARLDVALNASSAAEAHVALQKAEEHYRTAAEIDRDWIEPLAGLAEVAYRRARTETEAGQRDAWLDSASLRANAVLRREPLHALALEMRGNAQYVRVLANLDGTATEKLASVGADLSEVVRLNPRRASAWAVLSHMLLVQGDPAAALEAAERAFAADQYLALDRAGSLPSLLYRLFMVSTDLERYPEAARWCEEGRKWYHDDYRFADCELTVLMEPLSAPDTERAWLLAHRLDSLAPPQMRARLQSKSHAAVGVILAREAGRTGVAALADSARRVLRRAEHSAGASGPNEASVRALLARGYAILGDADQALDQLGQVARLLPLDSAFYQKSWWVQLRNHPGFAALAQTAGTPPTN